MSTATAAARVPRSPLRRAGGFSLAAPATRRLGTTHPDQVTGSNLVCVRDHNQLLVLHAIRTRGASTRRELSTLTGLTFQTIENISRRLIDGGILEDVPPPALTGRGRQLVLRPAGAYAIGIEASPDGCRLALCDLGGRTLAEQRLSLCAPGDDSSVDELALMVQDLIDDAEVPITTVVAVSLTATGSILIAHTPAVINGELCECGRRGCLQTVLAEQALRRSIATALSLTEPPTLDDISRRAISDADAAEVRTRRIPPGRHAPASGSAARPRDRHDRWSCRGRTRRSILQRSGTTRHRPRRRRARAGHPVRSARRGRGSERGARGPLRGADACDGPPHPRYGGRVAVAVGVSAPTPPRDRASVPTHRSDGKPNRVSVGHVRCPAQPRGLGLQVGNPTTRFGGGGTAVPDPWRHHRTVTRAEDEHGCRRTHQ